MSEQKVICGIDVGTTKIVAIIAEYSDDGNFSIIGIGESQSEGLERGVIVNIKDTIKSLELAIKEAEEQSQHEVDSVFVGISGDHIVGMNGMGVVSVGDAVYGNHSSSNGEKSTSKSIIFFSGFAHFGFLARATS